MVGLFSQNIAIYSFFAFETAKSAAKPVVKPINPRPTKPTPSATTVCAIAIAANVDIISPPANFLAE